jgi:hypothetical protein
LTGTSLANLAFPGYRGTVRVGREGITDILRIFWPEWMNSWAAFIVPEEDAVPGLKITFRIRPVRFDVSGMLAKVVNSATTALQATGVLDSFVSAVNPTDKLAVVWLALAILEDQDGQKRREGDLA